MLLLLVAWHRTCVGFAQLIKKRSIMVAKIAFVVLLALCLLHVTTPALIRQARDTPTPTAADAEKAIDDAVDSLKSGFDDLLKNIQSSDMLKDFSESMQKLGDTIQSQGKDLVQKIQASAQN